jgi:hypothetical protein
MAFAVMIDESRREVVAIEEPLGRPLIRLGGLNLEGSSRKPTPPTADAVLDTVYRHPAALSRRWKP